MTHDGMVTKLQVVAVDGAHLGSKFCGTLLLATGQDTNNQIFPLAFAIVGTESNLSWSFFFEQLKKSVVPDSVDTYFVSDRHHSIGYSIRKNYNLAGHGFCIYHLFRNLYSSTCPSTLRDQWFKVAKAYTVEEFNRELDILKVMSPSVVTKALKIPLEKWTRSHCPYERYNIMTTNNAECLNSVFKDERKWPIIPLFDSILQKISDWFCKRRECAAKWRDLSSEEVSKKLNIRHQDCLRFSVRRLSLTEVEVSDGMKRFVVNLHKQTCECRVFQKDRIPCVHAMAAAKDSRIDPTTLISHFHRNSTVTELYKETIYSVPPRNQWSSPTTTSQVQCLPPPSKRGPGRPHINRYKAAWERYGTRCTRCGQAGHTQKYCKR